MSAKQMYKCAIADLMNKGPRFWCYNTQIAAFYPTGDFLLDNQHIAGEQSPQTTTSFGKQTNDSVPTRLRTALGRNRQNMLNRKTLVFVGFLAFIFVALNILAIAKWNYSNIAAAFFDTETFKFLAGTAISVIASLIAAMAYTGLQNKQTENELELVRSLAENDLTISLLTDLYHYRGKHLEDYHVEIRLRATHHQDVTICQITYTYVAVNKHNPILLFRFNRIKNQEDAKAAKARMGSVTADEMYLNYEFQYTLDESSLAKKISESELSSLYKVRALSVDGHGLTLTKRNANDNEYEATLIGAPDRVRIHYTVEFPLETESFVSVLLNLPTSGITCKFDYHEVMGRIEVLAEDLLGSRSPLTPITDDGEITFDHHKWIFPRSGITFMWWKTDNNDAANPKRTV